MADLVGLVAGILQLVDTVATTRDYIQDFRNAPQDQRKLLEEIQSLDPLLGVLNPLIKDERAGLLKSLETPLKEVKEVLDELTTKLDLQGIRKVRSRLTWSLWGKKDVEDGLKTIERFKSSLNAWLGVNNSTSAQDILSAILNVAREQQKNRGDIIRSLASSSKAEEGYHQHTVSLFQNASTEHQLNHQYLSMAVRNVGRTQEQYLDRTISLFENAAEKQETHYNNLACLVKVAGKSQEQYRTAAERDELIEWYSPLNMFLRQADIFSNWEPGTGLWLLEHDSFWEWKTGTGKVLWCQGMPGAGKTVLASLITNTLRVEAESQNIGVAIIYLEHRETDVPPPSRLLTALWRQLVVGKPISSTLEQLYRKHREPRTRPTIKEDDAVLRSIITEYYKVFIIVDGLDEYPEEQRHTVLCHLRVLEPSVNLLLTSRPHITIDHIVSNFQTLEIRASEHDIRIYLDRKISKSFRLSRHLSNSPNLHQQLETTVVQRSDGMFLLAKLHADSLTEKRTVAEIRNALNDMTDDLDIAYGAVVDRINKQSEGDRKLAWRTLSWIALAKRPLQLSELKEALTVVPGEELDPENLPEMDIVLSVCAGLVEINEEDDRGPPESHIKPALLSFLGNCSQWRRLWTWKQGRALPANRLSLAAIFHLKETFDHIVKEDGVDFGALLHEAALRRATDVVRILIKNGVNVGAPAPLGRPAAQQTSCDGYDVILPFLINEGTHEANHGGMAISRQAEECLTVLIKSGTNINADGGPALRVAAKNGDTQIAKFLIESGTRIDASVLCAALKSGNAEVAKLLADSEASTDINVNVGQELAAAAENGNAEVISLLIESGADIRTHGRQALGAASKGGNTDILRLLIDGGADLDANDGLALVTASNARNIAAVKLLIESGANVNADDGGVLCAALKSGNAEIVKLLIDAGGDLNAKRGDVWRLALYGGSAKVIKLLIKAGADVNANNGEALKAASSIPNTEIFKLLIEASADIKETVKLLIGASTDVANGALCAASKNGDAEVAKLLIEGGANVNAYHGQALQAASRNGKTEVVELLVEAGVDVNAKSGAALSAASERGHTKVIQLLIEAGAKTNGGGPSVLSSHDERPEAGKILGGAAAMAPRAHRARSSSISSRDLLLNLLQRRVTDPRDTTAPGGMSALAGVYMYTNSMGGRGS
ncbi:ankyrin repeat-containing domain protein [Mycena polygramma]|nr:ankyrin repeat-containing domain protein [Mycena polygramma]